MISHYRIRDLDTISYQVNLYPCVCLALLPCSGMLLKEVIFSSVRVLNYYQQPLSQNV